MEILLTINGNREIPLDVSEVLYEKLKNNNSEVQFLVLLKASPTGEEIVYSQDDKPDQLIQKVKILSLQEYDPRI